MEEFQILDEENITTRHPSRVETIKNWIWLRKWQLLFALVFLTAFIGIVYHQPKLYAEMEKVKLEDIEKEEKIVKNLTDRIEKIEREVEELWNVTAPVYM